MTQLVGCLTSSNVVPVGKDRTSIETSLGGPLLKFKSLIVPGPLLAMRATHGMTDDIDAYGALHLTTLAFGLLGTELGAKIFSPVYGGWIPVFGASLGTLTFMSLRPGISKIPMMLPLLGGTAAWKTGAGYTYVGADGLWNTAPFSYLVDPPRATLSYFVGYRWDSTGGLSLTGEIKRYAVNWRTDQVAPTFYTIDGHGALKTTHPQNGALGVLFSVGWKI